MPVRTSQDAATVVTALYIAQPDPPMTALLAATGATQDHDIADTIEADARERLSRELPIPLRRYLGAVPRLTELRVALDAAIEFALRGLVAAGLPEAEAARRLSGEHPQLSAAIETAVALSDGLASTTTLGRSAGRAVPLAVPCEYGPRLPDGRRRFDVRQRLGVGSQGEVYLAADHLLSEADKPAWVAIKRLRPIATVDAAGHAAAESLKARRIDHRNVVRVLDRGTDDRAIEYIVYEHVDAGDLARWCAQRNDRVPTRDAARIAAAICRGVHAAHVAGVVHCDLKPSNILMTSAGEPKVADFGVAAAIRSDSGRIPDATPVGNLAFIAPEQYRADEGAQAIPADVYALGGLLFYLLTGKAPNGETPAQVAARHAHPDSPAPSPRAQRAEVDDDLDAICRRALSPRPADRHASAHALAEDLEAWLARRPLEWRKPSPWRRSALFVRRQPVAAGSAVLAICVLIGAAAGVTRAFAAAQQRVLREQNQALRTVQAEQADMLRRTRGVLETTAYVIRSRSQGGVGMDWMPGLTMMESLAGPLIFDSQTGQPTVDLWTTRVEMVGEHVAKAEAAGRGGDYEILLWRDALAFWALRVGKHEIATTHLSANDRYYEPILGPDDRWRAMRRGMRHVADVLRIADRPEGAPLTADDRRTLADSIAALEGLTEELHNDGHRRALRLLFLMAMKRAYAPDMLDNAAKVDELHKQLIKREDVPEDASSLPAAAPAPAPPATR